MQFDYEWNTIYLTLSGSHLYGTARPDSDLDLRGIILTPKSTKLSLFSSFEQTDAIPDTYFLEKVEKKTGVSLPYDRKEIDCTRFALDKFLTLALDNNPNIIELLFSPEECIIHEDPTLFSPFIEKRDLFLSQRCFYSFIGYAHSQFKKIKRHRGWLLHPPSSAPTRKEFGLPESHSLISLDQRKAAEYLIKKKVNEWLLNEENIPRDILSSLKERMIDIVAELYSLKEESEDTEDQLLTQLAGKSLGFDSNFIDYMKREKAYRNKKRHWDQYQEWKKNRNPKRAGMEKQSGFDLKHAIHLLRLSRMAKEILLEGKVLVKRPDAFELRGILAGKYTYEEIEQQFFSQEKELEKIMAGDRKEVAVPHKPARSKIEKLYMEIVSRAYSL